MKVEGAAAAAFKDMVARDGASMPAREELAMAALTPEEFALFADVGRVRRVYAGDVLFRRGELGTTMYVVVKGAIDLDFGDDLIVKRLGPAEFFGELGLLIGDHARSAEASVPVDGELLELHHEEFQRLVEREPGMVCYFLRRAIMRVVLNEQGLIRRLRRRNQDLEAALDNLRATAHQLQQTEVLIRTDELTGLANRRGMTRHLADRRRNGAMSGLGLLLVDCDSFKQINDDHGHLVGDRVLQVQVEAATVGQAREFIRPGEFFGLGEAVRGRAQGVECGLQVEVAAAQAADEALFVEHHAHDRAAQEVGEQARVAFDQGFEFLLAQFDQRAGAGDGGVGAARVVADQQAELAEELARAEALGDEVVAEVEVDRTLRDHVHRGAEVAAAEQLLARLDATLLSDLREQRVLLRGQRRGGFEHIDVSPAPLRRALAIHTSIPRRDRRPRIPSELAHSGGYGLRRPIRPPPP